MKNSRIDQLKIKKIFLGSSLILVFTISLSSCYKGGYGDRLPITGDIDITLNDKGDMCFKPLFDTATVGDSPIEIKYLKMEQLIIYDIDKVGGDYNKLFITPANEKYFIVYNKQEICINDNNSNLKQEVFANFEQDEKLVVHMAGLNDDEKDVYSTLFYKEFNYPYILE